VIGDTEHPRRGPLGVAATVLRVRHRDPQAEVGTEPVVLEKHHAEEGIPGICLRREGVGLAGQTVEAIAQGPVQPFQMHRVGLLDRIADRCADLASLPTPSRAMLDRLGPADSRGGPHDVPAGRIPDGSCSQ
jgi:hypothetical protein